MNGPPSAVPATPGSDGGLLAWCDGGLGRLHLNRPRSINALTLEVIRALRRTLEEWRSDPRIHTVALTGEGERGLCAGGDIRFVREHAPRAPERVLELWREEYALDLMIATYPKPFVAIADGVTMGGGIGLAGHASHTVVTPRSRLAMPEVRIGLAPDVAGLWLLARTHDQLGTHLALTGASADAATSLTVGWADMVVPVDELGRMVDDLRDAAPAEVLARYRTATDPAAVPDWMPRCYRHEDARDIVEALKAEQDPRADEAAEQILSASPTAVAVTLVGLRVAASLTVEECLLQDYRLSSRFLARPDLVEGIRAQVVDKDRTPRWDPAALRDVTPDLVESFFEPAPGEADLVADLMSVNRHHP